MGYETGNDAHYYERETKNGTARHGRNESYFIIAFVNVISATSFGTVGIISLSSKSEFPAYQTKKSYSHVAKCRRYVRIYSSLTDVS